MVLVDCNNGTLAPYIPSADRPWDLKRIQHLYRRAGFGEKLETLQQGLSSNPSDLVDSLVDQALGMPLTGEPSWSMDTYPADNLDVNELTLRAIEWSRITMDDMLSNGLRDKMVLFWSNHFVTLLESYLCPSYLYQYHRILQSNALGNFKDMVYEIGQSSAMLIFLNGVQNTRFSPNENYARELFELFTLGRDNGYTQNDIVEAARALTGFNGFDAQNLCTLVGYVGALHDPGQKTIFGQSGNYDFDGLHDVLFSARSNEIAEYICRKIYVEFVASEVSEDIVQGMAQTFITNNFQLGPVVRQLLKSEHFFDDSVLGTKFKSPFETYFQLFKELDIPYDQSTIDLLYLICTDQGQQLYNPPNVAGWPGDRAWINTTSLPARWDVYDLYVFNLYTNLPDQMVNWAKNLTNNSDDAAEVSRMITDFLIPVGLTDQEYYDEALAVFKGDIPENYFENGQWSLDWEPIPGLNLVASQILTLMRHVMRLPDYQLF